MDPTLAKMLDLRFFHENGYERRVCPSCKDPFWTTDPERTLCGDSNCVEYTFLGDPLTKKPLTVPQMREAFLAFFEGKGHRRVPRNPVVARWRDDIYLNIASIANYQPHVTSGEVPPPANPLVVSQPCIRLNDLANIGRSGRHFSCFEMMGHHAFNSKAWGEKYWTEECVAYGEEFLTKTLGLDGTRITFKESTWNGGGNAGPCVEVFAGGLEVATLVFMCLEERAGGPFRIKDEEYAMMDLRIIDTGWGLERLAWASTGTPTAYDTVFPRTLAQIRDLATVTIGDDERTQQLVAEHAKVQGVLNLDIGTRLDGLRKEVVKRLADHGLKTSVEELERVMEPVESMYALSDHLRCLSFMVGDGIVPSNVKAGYLMRLVLRRALRFQEKLGIRAPLGELLTTNMEGMLDEFPAFADALPRAREIADLETQRHKETQERGLRLVRRTLEKKRELGVEDLVELYDTHGLSPHTVAEAAQQVGVHVEVPATFDVIVAARHSREKKEKAKGLGIPASVPATRRVFYEHEGQWQREFDARVTWVQAGDGKTRPTLVLLDRTCFFHETGGQPGDQGALRTADGRVLRVVDTTKEGDHAVHHVESAAGGGAAGLLSVGDRVHASVDWERRMDHTRSHTATHIMNQAVRRVLGQHSWQAGTQKYQDCARVDMTHYRRPTREELHRIETLANRIVMEGRPVHREWWKREEAESKWGLTLLQGGIPKGRDVRVVRIGPVAFQDGANVAVGATPVGATLDPALPPVATHPEVLPDADFDVEYCGGTHCATTAQVGPVKLWRTERVQDGVERFEYSAGLHATRRWQEPEEQLRAAAEALAVAPAEVPAAAQRFFEEWKERGKLLEEVQARLAELESKVSAAEAEEVGGVKLVVRHDLPAGALQKTAAELIAGGRIVVLLGANDAGKVRLLYGRSADVDVDLGAVLRETAPMVGGRGGGKPDFAQGGGDKPEALGAALEKAKGLVRAKLG